MALTQLINENQLDEWMRANARLAQEVIVELLWRLVAASVPQPRTGAAWANAFVERHRPDELIVTANIHDPDARLRAYASAMEALRD
jgi:hypothetical protein